MSGFVVADPQALPNDDLDDWVSPADPEVLLSSPAWFLRVVD